MRSPVSLPRVRSDRYHHGLHVRCVFQNLESRGTLARDDQRVVKGMHQREATFLLQREGLFEQVAAGLDHFAAVPTDGVDL